MAIYAERMGLFAIHDKQVNIVASAKMSDDSRVERHF